MICLVSTKNKELLEAKNKTLSALVQANELAKKLSALQLEHIQLLGDHGKLLEEKFKALNEEKSE